MSDEILSEGEVLIDDNIVLVGDDRFLPDNEGGGSITVDSALSTTSTNPVENRVITNAINDKADSSSAYLTTDIVGTEIEDTDYFPFYNTAQTIKRKVLWSDVKNAFVKSISNNTNLNNITAVGWYMCVNSSVAATLTNCPTTRAFYMQVGNFGSDTCIFQVLMEYTTDVNDIPKIYWRTGNNDFSWVPWQRFYTTLDPSPAISRAVSEIAVDAANHKLTYSYVNNDGSATPDAEKSLPFVKQSGDTMSGNLEIDQQDGTRSAVGNSQLTLGNSTASGTSGNSRGQLSIYSDGTTCTHIRARANANGNTQNLYLPSDKDGYDIFTTGGGEINKSIQVNNNSGTTSSPGNTSLVAGNNKDTGTAQNSQGQLDLYSRRTQFIRVRAQDVTAAMTIWLPSSGTTFKTSASSSYRVKENIRDMTEEEARKILDIDVVKFDYKEEYENGKKDQSGVIAEEVVEIIPEVVNFSDYYDETKAIDPGSNPSPTVDYDKFSPYLIKMIQMQQERIDRLESIIEEMRR